MKRFGNVKIWVITLLLSVPVLVVAAVPNVFTSGTVISSAAVNANFAALDTRIAALEAAVQKRTSAQVVMNNVPGPLTKSVAFPSTGGTLLLVVSGSAFADAPGPMVVTVQLDAVTLGDLRTYTNEPSSHKAFPTKVFRVANSPAGNHTLVLTANTVTTTDGFDVFNATVIELPVP